MKDILDVIILILFAFMIFMFIKGFNKQQIEKHTKKIDENKKNDSKKKEPVNE